MKGRKRRTHYTAIVPTLSLCPRCKNHKQPHMACPTCGYYRGREVVAVLSLEEKKRAKEEARAKGPQG
jgi:large subunit ribosomal protein L32